MSISAVIPLIELMKFDPIDWLIASVFRGESKFGLAVMYQLLIWEFRSSASSSGHVVILPSEDLRKEVDSVLDVHLFLKTFTQSSRVSRRNGSTFLSYFRC